MVALVTPCTGSEKVAVTFVPGFADDDGVVAMTVGAVASTRKVRHGEVATILPTASRVLTRHSALPSGSVRVGAHATPTVSTVSVAVVPPLGRRSKRYELAPATVDQVNSDAVALMRRSAAGASWVGAAPLTVKLRALLHGPVLPLTSLLRTRQT